MTDQNTAPEGDATPDAQTDDDPRQDAFRERLGKESAKRKEADARAKSLETKLAELQARLEEREHEGLPELERERKRAESLEKRIAETEQRAAETEQRLQNTQRERWIAAAASKLNFIDPDDAARFVDLADIEDAQGAERAVKQVAKAKAHLVKDQDTKLPGRVMQDGRAAPTGQQGGSNIDLTDEARMLAEGLRQFASRD